MSQNSANTLKRLLGANGLETMMGPDPDQVVPHFLERLDQVTAEYRNCTHDNVSFSPEALEAEASKNPHKVRAFLQAFAHPCSIRMLVMAWRILLGLHIREIVLTYKEESAFNLVVVLVRPGKGPEILEEYRSDDIWDAVLLRQMGVCKTTRGPVFLGFNAKRLNGNPGSGC